MVSLTTSDNEQFTVDRDVAERSVLIKQMLEGKLSAEILLQCSQLRSRIRSQRQSLIVSLYLFLSTCFPLLIADRHRRH